MCSLQSILRAEANEELTFREFDTKFIEIWHSKVYDSSANTNATED